jgi:outer membrane protein OmpA-like peptidoglycan-associated protein
MRPFYFLFFFLIAISSSVIAQTSSYYVVIGAFKNEDNAKKYIAKAHELNIPAVYAQHSISNSYYVYVRRSANRASANVTMTSMREEGFDQAWVFEGSLGDHNPLAIAVAPKKTSPPVLEMSEPSESGPLQTQLAEAEEPIVEVAVTEDPATPVTTNESLGETPPLPAGKPFIFNLTNQKTGEKVKGIIRLLESERATEYIAYTANEKINVVPPFNKAGKYVAICQVVGYKIAKKQVSYKSKTNDGQEISVPIVLTPVTKGDYVELEGISFIENSDVMKPESQQSLDELVSMMEDNEKYKIRIHGHTNGNDAREIISLTEDGDFFSLDGANEPRQGSAKELSALRANTIKRYLISKGISESRVEARGEGGKQPIFESKSRMAHANARVEVEIVKS